MAEFWNAIGKLERHYGKPKPPPLRGPFEMIVYEIVAYLADEPKRRKAFEELMRRVGTKPRDILGASTEELVEIAAMGGIFAELRAERLQQSAQIVCEEFGGDLKA